MSVSELTASTQNYLKVIWSLSEWSDEPVTTSTISERTGLKLSTVSEAVRRLTEQGLLHHAPYGAVELTETGCNYALAMIRRHRLIESFLVSALGYRTNQVHDEAENLEHAVSDFMVDRIDEFLGHPTRDPHGDPIPSADGEIVRPEAIPLSAVEPDAEVVVERISDFDPDLLGFLDDQQIVVGTRLIVTAGAPYSDAVNVRVAGSDTPLALGKAAISEIYVSTPTASDSTGT